MAQFNKHQDIGAFGFDDIYRDFLATTGHNLKGTLSSTGWTEGGGTKRDFMGEVLTTSNDMRVETFDKQAKSFEFQRYGFMKGYGPRAGGSWTGSTFSDEFYGGLGAQAPGSISKRLLAARQTEDATRYEDWTRESALFQAETDAAFQNAQAADLIFDQTQLELDEIRAGLPNAASKASSMGAYSQAAKRQMQQTQTTIAKLGAVTSPAETQAKFTFKDPTTGEERAFTDEFDAEAAYNSVSTLEDAQRLVNDKFTTRRDEITTQLWNDMNIQGGFDPLEFSDAGSDLRRSFQEASKIWDNMEYIDQYNSRSYDKLTDDWTIGAMQQGRQIVDSASEINKFAEYRSLAELSGTTEGFGAETVWSEYGTQAITGTQAMSASVGDINEALDLAAKDTFARFEIADLNDIDNTRDEFYRRRDLAESTAMDTVRRNEMNKTRQQSLVEEKRKYEQQLELQQAEYASTLSSFGATEDRNGGISFNQIRPQ